MKKVTSPSEQSGLAKIKPTDLHIMSIGISTGGEAERKMIENNLDRIVVATTLDTVGAANLKQKLVSEKLIDRLDVRVEDIAGDIDYPEASFDFIYARLVLHYLSEKRLNIALNNIKRILKPNGQLFVVVRSDQSDEAKQKDNKTDPITKLTTYRTASGTSATRYFHSQASIKEHITNAGLIVDEISQYDEKLSPSFSRDNGVWVLNNVIEVISHKEGDN